MSSKIAILGGQRTPFARSMGAYMGVSNLELQSHVLKSLVQKFDLSGEVLGEVAMGAVMKHSRDWNMAREATLSSGLSAQTPAVDVQRACGTSLETAILVGNKIALGQIEVGLAGGSDTNSDLPVVFSTQFSQALLKLSRAKSLGQKLQILKEIRPKDLKPIAPAVIEARTQMSMGQSCEKMAQEWQIPRAEQDELSLMSHQNAAKAYENSFYTELLTSFCGLEADNNVRADTNLEKLTKLKPVFDRSPRGTITAGNASPLTDGASVTLLSSEAWAKGRGIEPLAYLTHSQSAAVDFVEHEGLLMAPAYAVPKLLKKAGLNLQDFDFYEIHEAFAAQVLCTLKAWESESFCKDRLGLDKALGQIDRSKMNLVGGSVALGHPFAATGSRILTSLAHQLKNKGQGRGLISICTAGGMGIAAIVER